jgi:hypothetical protein
MRDHAVPADPLPPARVDLAADLVSAHPRADELRDRRDAVLGVEQASDPRWELVHRSKVVHRSVVRQRRPSTCGHPADLSAR